VVSFLLAFPPISDSVVKYATKNRQFNIQEGDKFNGDVTESLESKNAGIITYGAGDFVDSSLNIYYMHLIKCVTTNATSKTTFLISVLQVS
jgi:hypothetical protein